MIFSLCLLLILGIIFFEKISYREKILKYIVFLCLIEILNLKGVFLFTGISFKFIIFFWTSINIIYYFYKYKNIKLDKKFFWLSIILIFSVLLGFVNEMIFPYDGLIIARDWDAYIAGIDSKEKIDLNYIYFVTLYLKMIFYIILTYIIKSEFTIEELLMVGSNVLKYSKFVIVYGFIEYTIKNILDLPDIITTLSKIVLGSDIQTSIRGDLYGLVGLTTEPSHFAMCIFNLIILNFILRKVKEKVVCDIYIYNKLELILLFILLILTRGFSAYWYFIIIISIYFTLKNNMYDLSIKILVKYILFFVILLVGIVYIINIVIETSAYSNIISRINQIIYLLNEVDFNSNIEAYAYIGSSLARFISIHDGFIDFLNRPLLGLGLGVELVHSGIVMLLTDIGLIGIYFLLKIVLFKINNRIKYDICFFILFFIIANIPLGLRNIGFEVYSIFFIELTSIYCKKVNENDTQNNTLLLDK